MRDKIEALIEWVKDRWETFKDDLADRESESRCSNICCDGTATL